MRERLARFAAVSALALTVVMCPSSSAQQDKERSAGDQKLAATMSETIHGIVAGVTAEGEVYFNPQDEYGGEVGGRVSDDRRLAATFTSRRQTSTGPTRPTNEKHDGNRWRRHNVYMVWMTPKTKVCCENGEGSDRSQGNKSEVTLDKLEVGDHVEGAVYSVRRLSGRPERAPEPANARKARPASHPRRVMRRRSRSCHPRTVTSRNRGAPRQGARELEVVWCRVD